MVHIRWRRSAFVGVCILTLLLAGCGRAAGAVDLAASATGAPKPTTAQETKTSVVNGALTSSLDPEAVVAAEEQVINRVYEELLPSVVHIRVVEMVETQALRPSFEFPFDFPFGFDRSFPMPGQEPGEFFRRGEGSGFVWSEDGHIVTNYHVVAGADRVAVTFSDGTEATAQIVGGDPNSDLAVLKVDVPSDHVYPVELGDIDEVRVGQLAIALGNPFGQEFTLTTGIVSALGRTIRAGSSGFSIPEVIQTDAAINPGNSGGPLLDRQGRVIGINTQIISRSGASAGVGFAVPVNTAKRVVPALITDGHYDYAYLGVTGTTLRPDVAQLMDLPEDTRGALVIDVADGGPADEAHVKGSDRRAKIDGAGVPVGGDVIVAINGSPVKDMDDLIAYLVDNARPGDQVTLGLIRQEGETAEVIVTLGSRPRLDDEPDVENGFGQDKGDDSR